MSEIVYINDPRGGRIPLTDEFGNLSIDVMFLYNEDKLPAEDKAKVEAIVANDEMAKDALEGYALMNSAPKAKAIIGDIGKEIITGKPTRKPVVVPMFSARTWAVAASLAIVVGIGSVLVSRMINQDQLAMNEETPEPAKNEMPVADEKTDRPEFNLATDTISETLVGSDDSNGRSEVADSEADDVLISPRVSLKEQSFPPVAQEKQPVETKPKAVDGDIDESERNEDSAKREELLTKMAELKERREGLGYSSTPVEAEVPETVALDLVEDDLEEGQQEDLAQPQYGSEPIGSIRGARNSADQETLDVYTDAFEYFNFNEVQAKPTFPGGDVKMWEFLESNKRHSEELKSQGIGGEVFVSFIINEKGKITNVEILTSKVGSPELEKDAKRVIMSMPNWTPGKMAGNPVKVKKTMMVKYPVE